MVVVPTFTEHQLALEKTLGVILKDIHSWHVLQSKPYIGHSYQRPQLKENGSFKWDSQSPIDVMIDWFANLENIYGKNILKWQKLVDFGNHLEPFFTNVETCPPFGKRDEPLSVKALHLIVQILNTYTDAKGILTLPTFADLTNKSYDLLTRDNDTFSVEVAILGVSVEKEIKFKNGLIRQLDFEERVDILRDQSKPNPWALGRDTSDVLLAESILILNKNVPRIEKIMMFPQVMQSWIDNVVKLLQIYFYADIKLGPQNFYLEEVAKSKLFSLGYDFSASSKKIKIANIDCDLVANFISNNFINERLENDHELSFILNRLSEAWKTGKIETYRIFDFVAMLEAILMQFSESEAQYKVSLYTAHLLSTMYPNKEATFNLVRKAYKTRNAIDTVSKKLRKPTNSVYRK